MPWACFRRSFMHLSSFLTSKSLIISTVLFVACEAATPGAVGPDNPLDALGSPAFAVDGTVEIAEFEVCKTYSGAVGPAVTVDFTVDFDGDGSNEIVDFVSLGDGDCAIVHTYDETNSNGGLQIQRVTVTEQVPPGYDPTYVLTTKVGASEVTDPPVAGNSASGDMLSNPDNGFLVEFVNTEIPVTGGEGCTPGYWKQAHHFDSWTPPLDPASMFTDPGFTSPGSDARVKRGRNENDVASQLDALEANQGGLAALTRHAMAALLNAASSGVSYAFTQAEVIQMYNDALSGALDVETTKDLFDAANNGPDGCPLN